MALSDFKNYGLEQMPTILHGVSRPGQAQPVQPQQQGNPYGQRPTPDGQQQGGGAYSAYAPQTYNFGKQGYDQSMTAWAQPKQNLMQWGQNYQQPQMWQPQTQAQNAYGPMDNNTLMQQRMAAVQQINNQSAQQQVGTYLGQGQPPAGWGQNSFNPQQMWDQANQMVQQGWQDPFGFSANFSQPSYTNPGQQAQFGFGGPQASPYGSAPSASQSGGAPSGLGSSISDLFAGAGIQAPAGFMDKLLGLLGNQSGPSAYGGPQMGPTPPVRTDPRAGAGEPPPTQTGSGPKVNAPNPPTPSSDKDSRVKAIYDDLMRKYQANQGQYGAAWNNPGLQARLQANARDRAEKQYWTEQSANKLATQAPRTWDFYGQKLTDAQFQQMRNMSPAQQQQMVLKARAGQAGNASPFAM